MRCCSRGMDLAMAATAAWSALLLPTPLRQSAALHFNKGEVGSRCKECSSRICEFLYPAIFGLLHHVTFAVTVSVPQPVFGRERRKENLSLTANQDSSLTAQTVARSLQHSQR